MKRAKKIVFKNDKDGHCQWKEVPSDEFSLDPPEQEHKTPKKGVHHL